MTVVRLSVVMFCLGVLVLVVGAFAPGWQFLNGLGVGLVIAGKTCGLQAFLSRGIEMALAAAVACMLARILLSVLVAFFGLKHGWFGDMPTIGVLTLGGVLAATVILDAFLLARESSSALRSQEMVRA